MKILKRVCAYRNCNQLIDDNANKKKVFHTQECKQKENKLRREERDVEFNSQVKAFKNNYLILQSYTEGSTLTYEELANREFDFDALFPIRTSKEGQYFAVGHILLIDHPEEPRYKIKYRKIKENATK